MPILKPNSNETRDTFISRCMSDSKMVDEFPDNDQRAAVCNTSWKDVKSNDNSRSLDVEIFATGLWNGFEFKKEDLSVIAIAFDTLKSVHKVPLKFGHNDEQPMTDGQPALGWVADVWVAGNKLMARFTDIPEQVYTAMRSKLYRHVSVELDMGVEHKGNYYSWVLSGVALLGADIPAVNTLADLTAYMGKSELCFKKRVAFTAIDVKQSKGDINMSLEQEIETFKATIKAKDNEINKLIVDNTALKKENMQMKADQTAFEAAEQHRKKTEDRTGLLTKLDNMVKERKINPAIRDDFMREYDNAEDSADTKAIMFAVDKMIKTIDNNPVYFGAEQARIKADRDRQEEELPADQVVVSRTREYMSKHGEKNFNVAKQIVLKADMDLANRYTKMTGTGG